MAQLNGIKIVSNGVIEYEGVRYEKTEGPAGVGDIAQHTVDSYSYLPQYAFYGVVEAQGEVSVIDEDGDVIDIEYDADFTVFRRAEEQPSTADLLAAKRADLDKLRAEITELEARLVEESTPKVGDYARLTKRSFNHGLDCGEIVRVIKIDGSHIPFKVRSIVSRTEDWAEKCEKLTPAEARAALIAQVEALFSGSEAA